MSEVNNDTNSIDPDDNTPYAWESPLHAAQIVKTPEQLRLLSERLFSRLAELGITKVTIGFSSWNDDGFIKHMLTERSAANTGLSLKEATFDGKRIYVALEEFVYAQLNASHSGWLKDDGSFGTYTFDVERREMHEDFVVREIGVRNDLPEEDDEERLEDSLFTRLAELGVGKLLVMCAGGGDSGEVKSAKVKMEPGSTVPLLKETEFEGIPIWDAIEEVVLTHLSNDHPGWELDWGSDATYTLDVTRRTVTCKIFAPCAVLDVEDEDEDEDEEFDGNEQ